MTKRQIRKLKRELDALRKENKSLLRENETLHLQLDYCSTLNPDYGTTVQEIQDFINDIDLHLYQPFSEAQEHGSGFDFSTEYELIDRIQAPLIETIKFLEAFPNDHSR